MPERRIPTYCKPCRDRHWEAAGPTAHLLGQLVVDDGGNPVEFWQTRRTGFRTKHVPGRENPTFQSGSEEAIQVDDSRTHYDVIPIDNGLKVRCRNGHDLRFTRERFTELVAHSDTGPLYLPGS